MLHLTAWAQIDGETVVGLLKEAVRLFPQPVQVELESGTVVVADYQVWKQKVIRRQQKPEAKDE